MVTRRRDAAQGATPVGRVLAVGIGAPGGVRRINMGIGIVRQGVRHAKVPVAADVPGAQRLLRSRDIGARQGELLRLSATLRSLVGSQAHGHQKHRADCAGIASQHEISMPEPGSLIPIKHSLHIAVFEVPSVIDWVEIAPWLFELLYQGLVPGTMTPDHSLIEPGPPTFAW